MQNPKVYEKIISPFTDATKKELAQKCFYANIYNIEFLGKEFKISNLIQEYGPQAILNFMKLYFLKIVKISKIENCISDEAQLDFVIRTWVSHHAEKDIREYAMVLQNGIAGLYGSTYNRILTDTLGFWTKAYLDTTKPTIMQRIQNNAAKNETKKTLLLSEPTTAPVSCPDDIQKATDALVQKYNIDLTPKKSLFQTRRHKLRKYLGVREYQPSYPVKKQYASIEDYCTENGIKSDDFISKLEEKFLMDFNIESDISPQEFLKGKMSCFLESVNS